MLLVFNLLLQTAVCGPNTIKWLLSISVSSHVQGLHVFFIFYNVYINVLAVLVLIPGVRLCM